MIVFLGSKRFLGIASWESLVLRVVRREILDFCGFFVVSDVRGLLFRGFGFVFRVRGEGGRFGEI